jgi:hypothetical protein
MMSVGKMMMMRRLPLLLLPQPQRPTVSWF